MNARQRRFAEIYAASPNATQAAKRAGYSEKTARQIGQRLLSKVDIANYIRELQEEAAGARIATIEDVKGFWTEVMNNESERTAVRLKASELLAKAAGLFLPQGAEEDDEQKTDVVIYLPEIDRPEDHTVGAVQRERAK